MFGVLAMLSVLIYLGKSPATALEEGKCTAPESFKDVMACKRGGCEYNLVTKSCQAAYTECDVGVGITGCRRSNSFYIEEGVAYHYKGENQGDCTIKSVLRAVNLGTWGKFTDSTNMTYESDSSYSDPTDSRRGVYEGSQCQYNVTGINPVDNPIWTTQILGRSDTRVAGNCVTYSLKIVKNGAYELNIKTVESSILEMDKTRQFNIRINGIDIVPEFNILNYVKLCEALEIVIEFEARQGFLYIAGLPSQDVLYHGTLDIGFCYGNVTVEAAQNYFPDYLVSAFYVAEMNGVKDSDVSSCSGGSGTGGGGGDNSNDTDIFRCRRANVTYFEGGVASKSKLMKDKGDCQVKNTVIAVNLGGDPLTDSRKVEYLDFESSTYIDKDNIAVLIYPARTACKDSFSVFPYSDRNLYIYQIHADDHRWKRGRCLIFPGNVTEDGRYELSIKTVESNPTWGKVRYFNIRLNDVVVAPEFHILDYAQPCEGMEIIIEFKVKNGNVHVAGFPNKPIKANGTVEVGFCYGDKKYSPYEPKHSPHFLISAFYIARI